MMPETLTKTDQGADVAPNLPSVDAQEGNAFDLLSGIRVLDLTTSVAGPSAAMMLGDLGAEVVKVERPGTGDDARHWGPPFLDGESLWFLAVNRGKKSLTLDYTHDDGYAILRDLVAKSDVVIVNMPPRVQTKLRVDESTLRELNPRLIFASITGFGLQGSRKDQTCYDLIAEGYSAVMDLTGEPDSPPQKVGTPAADMLAGQDAATAIVAALFARERNGQGRGIDVSLVDSMTRFMACRIVPFLGSGELPRRSGGRDSVIAIYQAFETADLPLTLGLGNDGIWKRFWTAMGDPEFADRAEYSGNAARRDHRADIVAKIQSILLTRPRDHWLEVCREARVPAGPINSVADVANDREFHDRGLVYLAQAGERQVPQVGLGIHIDGSPSLATSLPPRLGEHTDTLMRDLLGLPEDRIRDLADREITTRAENVI